MFSRLGCRLRSTAFRSFSQSRTGMAPTFGRSFMSRGLMLGTAAGLASTLMHPWETHCSDQTASADGSKSTVTSGSKLSPGLQDVNSLDSDLYLFVGSYTEPVGHCPNAHGDGIQVFKVDRCTGALTEVHTESMESPSFLALGYDKNVLYAVSESDGYIASFQLSKKGRLRPLNRKNTAGQAPCYVNVLGEAPGYAVVANYGMTEPGSLVTLELNSNGSIGGIVDVHHHSGKSVNPCRQDYSHIHSVVSQDSFAENVFVADLGTDQVRQYNFNPGTGIMVANRKSPYCSSTVSGDGPRHIAFHPNGKSVYVSNELTSSVAHYRYLSHSGRLHPLQTVTTLPFTVFGSETTGTANSVADIQAHPSGDYVYVSNRGDDSIAVYSVDKEGTLTPIGHTKTRGKAPRNFCMDHTGRMLVVANQESDTVETFSVGSDGLLSHMASTPVNTPVFVKMAWL